MHSLFYQYPEYRPYDTSHVEADWKVFAGRYGRRERGIATAIGTLRDSVLFPD